MICDKCAGTGKVGKYGYRCCKCYGTGSPVGIVKYAGVGARKSPEPVLAEMATIAMRLAMHGFILCSGGAIGADKAFERGADLVGGRKTIRVATMHQAAMEHAAHYHPKWNACDERARGLHARNSLILLGDWLDDPVSFVVCWTEGGAVKGGTGQALRVASAYNIPVFNLGITPVSALWGWLDGTNG